MSLSFRESCAWLFDDEAVSPTQKKARPMLVRLDPRHRSSLADLLSRTREFTREEVDVALELIDLGIAGGHDYRFWVDEGADGAARGYICFGRTPMTESTCDLYWIAVDSSARGSGIGKRLVRAMEDELKREGARLIRVETSSTAAYAASRAFYLALDYRLLATIEGFYALENDLCIYGKVLG